MHDATPASSAATPVNSLRLTSPARIDETASRHYDFPCAGEKRRRDDPPLEHSATGSQDEQPDNAESQGVKKRRRNDPPHEHSAAGSQDEQPDNAESQGVMHSDAHLPAISPTPSPTSLFPDPYPADASESKEPPSSSKHRPSRGPLVFVQAVAPATQLAPAMAQVPGPPLAFAEIEAHVVDILSTMPASNKAAEVARLEEQREQRWRISQLHAACLAAMAPKPPLVAPARCVADNVGILLAANKAAEVP
ncbi:hypothetical protein T484DRAFT_2027113 [Baffinella frigidus]|nr:hypothetical protein T484DRAFT_2027113 [Cryptophyta sp. CCMP2293]